MEMIVHLFLSLIFLPIDEKFVSIDDDEPFQFNVYSDPEENQKRYEAIGKLVDEAVFEMLQHRCGLTRVTIPVS